MTNDMSTQVPTMTARLHVLLESNAKNISEGSTSVEVEQKKSAGHYCFETRARQYGCHTTQSHLFLKTPAKRLSQGSTSGRGRIYSAAGDCILTSVLCTLQEVGDMSKITFKCLHSYLIIA